MEEESAGPYYVVHGEKAPHPVNIHRPAYVQRRITIRMTVGITLRINRLSTGAPEIQKNTTGRSLQNAPGIWWYPNRR